MTDLIRLTNNFFGLDNFEDEAVYSHSGGVDITENESGYRVEIDMPGFDENELDISVDKGYLTIKAERKTEENSEDNEKGRYIVRQRKYSSFSRSFKLGENIDKANISAKLEKGVLSLELAKKEESKPVQIKIN